MTSTEPSRSSDVGPRICDACRWEFHDRCQVDDFCECLVTYCYEPLVEAW